MAPAEAQPPDDVAANVPTWVAVFTNAVLGWTVDESDPLRWPFHRDGFELINLLISREIVRLSVGGANSTPDRSLAAGQVIFDWPVLTFECRKRPDESVKANGLTARAMSTAEELMKSLRLATAQVQLPPYPVAEAASADAAGSRFAGNFEWTRSKKAVGFSRYDSVRGNVSLQVVATLGTGSQAIWLQHVIAADHGGACRRSPDGTTFICDRSRVGVNEGRDHRFQARLEGSAGPDLRIQVGDDEPADPIYDLLRKRNDFSVKLHELPLYLVGHSLMLNDRATLDTLRRLYATRNKIVHAGQVDATVLSLSGESVVESWNAVQSLLLWLGQGPPSLNHVQPFGRGPRMLPSRMHFRFRKLELSTRHHLRRETSDAERPGARTLVADGFRSEVNHEAPPCRPSKSALGRSIAMDFDRSTGECRRRVTIARRKGFLAAAAQACIPISAKSCSSNGRARQRFVPPPP